MSPVVLTQFGLLRPWRNICMHLLRVRRENRLTFLSNFNSGELLAVSIEDIVNHIHVICIYLGGIGQKAHFESISEIITIIVGRILRSCRLRIRFSVFSVLKNGTCSIPPIFLYRTRFVPSSLSSILHVQPSNIPGRTD